MVTRENSPRPIAPLLLVPEVVDGADAQRIAGGDGSGVAAVHTSQLLHREDVGQIVQFGAAVLLPDDDTE